MIQINPLQSYIDGGARAAITSPPSASLVFDLPGKAIWVKGVKLKGIDHTYTFSHDNYITLTNTPDQNNPESEDIKIGVNITALKNVIDTTYSGGTLTLLQEGLNTDERIWLAKILHNYIDSVLPTTKNIKINGIDYAIYTTEDTLPLFFAPESLGTTGQILSCTSTGLSWVNLIQNTDYRVSLSTATNNNDYRIILKQEPDNNPETSFVRFSEYLTFNPSTKILKINNSKVITAADIYVGATSTTDATAGLVPAAASTQRAYFLRGDGTWLSIVQKNTWRPIKVNSSEKLGSGTNTGAVDFVAGTGITLGWDATNKKITITNSAPDQNHNTDRTGIKLGTVSGTKKTDSTVILANSTVGLTIAGGTNKFSIGDGTNYIEVPITISHGLSTKNITINGTAYAIYTSASSLPTFVAPGSYAGTGGYILATNSAKNGLEWVAKPTSNVTTTAIVGNSATATSQIAAAQTNPYYNLLEGGLVTRSIRFVAGTGITISAATDGLITITNASPDVNHNTHYVTSMYIGENNDTKANAAATNPYLKLFDDNVRRSTLRFVSGTGITIGSDANGNITITNSAPDVNHNTDRTGVKLGTVSGTQKTNSTLIIANSGTGLVFQGGTNLFKIGDGTNYIQVPITPSFTVTDKAASILTSATTLATINGTDITAKVAVVNSSPTLTTSLKTIATIAGVEIKAKITNYNTDLNVKQTPKTDNVNRPLMMINGGTSAGELTSTSMFSTGIYANASSKMITANGFVKAGSDNTYVLLGGGGASKISTLSVSTAAKVTVTNSDDNSTYRLVWHSSNNLYSTGGIYCNPRTDCIYASHYYETSDRAKKTNIEYFSEHIRKFTLKASGKTAYGVIAQEVAEMFREGEDGNMTVNYSSVLSYYIGALENRIKVLEDEINKLKNK